MKRQDENTVVTVLNMQAYGGSGNMAALIFNLEPGRGKWLTSYHRHFNPKKKNLQWALNIRFLVGPKTGLEVLVEGKILFYQP